MRLRSHCGSVGAFCFCLKLVKKPLFLKICAICRGVEKSSWKLYMLHKKNCSVWGEKTRGIYIWKECVWGVRFANCVYFFEKNRKKWLFWVNILCFLMVERVNFCRNKNEYVRLARRFRSVKIGCCGVVCLYKYRKRRKNPLDTEKIICYNTWSKNFQSRSRPSESCLATG